VLRGSENAAGYANSTPAAARVAAARCLSVVAHHSAAAPREALSYRARWHADSGMPLYAAPCHATVVTTRARRMPGVNIVTREPLRSQVGGVTFMRTQAELRQNTLSRWSRQ